MAAAAAVASMHLVCLTHRAGCRWLRPVGWIGVRRRRPGIRDRQRAGSWIRVRGRARGERRGRVRRGRGRARVGRERFGFVLRWKGHRVLPCVWPGSAGDFRLLPGIFARPWPLPIVGFPQRPGALIPLRLVCAGAGRMAGGRSCPGRWCQDRVVGVRRSRAPRSMATSTKQASDDAPPQRRDPA
jgi:hypothetical protein